MSSRNDQSGSLAAGGRPGAEPEAPDEAESHESWLKRAARAPEVRLRVALPKPGRVIGGKYKIEEQLGQGGMGAVYRATHVVSGKQVALKWMLRPSSDERAQQRFTREARAAGRVDHPNVVDVYDIGQDGEASYLVMELLRGETFRMRLSRGPLSPTDVVDCLLPAMRGVAAAHREGVVHRDLKPDNIFLCRGPDGTEREAKVLDFGISSINAPDFDSSASLTKEGMVLGTPTYMSPEQLESAKDVDARSDVYAFGVILYEALTGFVPFVADSYSALVLAIAQTKPMPPRELRPEIPAALEQVVIKAMDSDRSTRVQTMQALIAELSPFASVASAGSGEHAPLEHRASVPPPRGRRGSVVAIIAVALAALGVGWWLSRGSESTPAPSTKIESPAMTPQPAATPSAALRAAGAATAASTSEVLATNPKTAAVTPAAPSSATPAPTMPATPRVAKKLTASEPTPPPSGPSVQKKARSGTIAVDDL